MSTTTTRHTARPSRLRVCLARLGAWTDRHDDKVTLAVVATIVTCVSALVALALIGDGIAIVESASVALIVVVMSGVSAFFAYMVGTDKATRRVSRRYSRYMNEQTDRHADALAQQKRESIGHARIGDMSAYDMSAELARLSEREQALRYALRYTVRHALVTQGNGVIWQNDNR